MLGLKNGAGILWGKLHVLEGSGFFCSSTFYELQLANKNRFRKQILNCLGDLVRLYCVLRTWLILVGKGVLLIICSNPLCLMLTITFMDSLGEPHPAFLYNRVSPQQALKSNGGQERKKEMNTFRRVSNTLSTCGVLEDFMTASTGQNFSHFTRMMKFQISHFEKHGEKLKNKLLPFFLFSISFTDYIVCS